MQSYFGVTAAQSAATGYPVFEPGAGFFALAASVGGRKRIARDWVLLYGAGASRLLGAAADSPLTRQPASWSVNSGLVYQF